MSGDKAIWSPFMLLQGCSIHITSADFAAATMANTADGKQVIEWLEEGESEDAVMAANASFDSPNCSKEISNGMPAMGRTRSVRGLSPSDTAPSPRSP
ncbi:MAG: hypothetical protein Gyms2KO_28860 [Gymnodinialimonas sp.]